MEEEFKVDFTPENKINLTTQSINPNQARQDKRVVIIDKNNRNYNSSSIMMGYNKAGFMLGDGNFVSADELAAAMNEAVSKYEEGTVIVNKKTQKPLDINEFIMMLKAAQGALILGGRSEAITNQDTKTIQIESADGRRANKGVLFLGNHGLKLGTGEYVSLDEFSKAIKDYVAVSKTVIPSPIPVPKPSEPKIPESITTLKPKESKEERQFVRVVKKYKNRASLLMASVGCIAVLLSGLRLKDNIKQIQVPTEVSTTIAQTINEDNLYFSIDGITYEYETATQTVKRVTEKLTMGEELNIPDGKSFNTNSLETGTFKTIGKEFEKEGKKSGNYRVTGFAIVHGDKILNYIEDFDALDNTAKLQNLIDKTLDENSLDYNDIKVMVHLGANGNNTRLGWINITELINADTITEDMIAKTASRFSVEKGSVENFNGDSLTLTNGVTLKVVDENGNLLSRGTTVVGSDGNMYVINDLSLKEESKTVMKESTKTINVRQNVVDGKKLSWSITDCNFALGVAPLIASISFALANKKKNKQAQANPDILKFANEEEYLKFKQEFIKAKNKYEKSSKFNQVLKRMFFHKRIDVMQKLTQSQIKELYQAIIKHSGKDFSVESSDKISFKDGKILIIYHDGGFMDITDIVMPDIHSIGQNNEIVAEGRLR